MSICRCTERALRDQPIMPLLHVMMAEIVPKVHLEKRACGHTIITAPEGEWTQEHTEALNQALALLGMPPISDEVKTADDVVERLA